MHGEGREGLVTSRGMVGIVTPRGWDVQPLSVCVTGSNLGDGARTRRVCPYKGDGTLASR